MSAHCAVARYCPCCIAIVALLGFVSLAAAQDSASAPVSSPTMTARPWKGEIEAGLITANGNSKSESHRARLQLSYAAGPWKHGGSAETVRVSERGATTTEQYTASIKTTRSLSTRSYAFGTTRYEADRIAGYSPRVAESVGYGRRFLLSERLLFEAEAGPGGSHTWYTDGTRKSEAILRLALRAAWKIGVTSELSEDAFSELGEKNVHTESQTSFKSRINASFSLKMNVQIKHNTVVLADRHKTDTLTSVTLVYDL